MNDTVGADAGAGFLTSTTSSSRKVILEDSEVHLWTVDLKVCGELVSSQASFLDSRELARAGRFKSDTRRDEYMAAHVVQRSVLAFYTGEEPEKILLEEGMNGKPVLGRSAGHESLCFNMSYSRGFALFVVSMGREVGVDVEFINGEIFKDGNTENLLSPSETLFINSLPHERRTRAMFDIWTAKEAFAKGVGHGLSFPFENIEIEYESCGSGKIRSSGQPVTEELEAWTIFPLDVGENYSGAVAVRGECNRLKTIEFNKV